MTDLEQIATRYLLGELSEAEQAMWEEKYFTDELVFAQLLKSESELLDQYVRGELSAQARERLEQSYLINPRRRERMLFAEALATRLDQIEAVGRVGKGVLAVSLIKRLFPGPQGRQSILGFSLALASLILVVAASWFFISSRRARHELAQRQAALAEQQQRTRELEQQIAAERQRVDGLSAQLDHGVSSEQQLPPQKVSTPTPTASGPTFASLILTVGGVRSAESSKTPTLVIPAGTTQVRLQLNLTDHDYTGYRVSLRAVGGGEFFTQAGLKPRLTKSGARFTLSIPARQFATGDYILTLSAVSQGEELEDLSKSIFRVEKR